MARVSLKDWFLFNLKVGALSFGGSGRLLLYQDALVEKKQWMTVEEFNRAYTYSSVFPGPNLVNICVYCGLLLNGWVAAILGVLALAVPGAFVALAIVSGLDLDNRHVAWIFQGFSLGSIFLFSIFFSKLFKSLWTHAVGIRKPILRLLLAGIVAAMSFAKIPILLILTVGIGLGTLLEWRVD